MSNNDVKNEPNTGLNEEGRPLMEKSNLENSSRQKTEASVIIKHDTSEWDLFKGLLCMAASCIFKSLFSIFSKIILKRKKELSSFQMLTFRTYFMFWIAVFSLLIGRINIFSSEFIKPNRLFQVCLRTVFALISMSLVIYSLKFMNISDVYAIYYVYPALVILLSYIFLREKLGCLDFLCLFCCFVGAIFIIKPEFIFHTLNSSSQNNLFYVFVFLGALFKSAEDVIVREVKHDVHFLAYPFFYAFIGMLLFPIPMAIKDRHYPTFDTTEVILLVLIGACTFAYQTFMALGLQNENAGRVSMINYLQVALMYLSDLFIFHKAFNWLDFIGILLIFGFNFGNGLYKALERIGKLEEVKREYEEQQRKLPAGDEGNKNVQNSNIV